MQLHCVSRWTVYILQRWYTDLPMSIIQSNSGERVNILAGESIGHCEREKKLIWTRLQFWTLTEIQLFESGAHCSSFLPFDFCLRGWMRNEVYKRNMDTWDELRVQILDAAAHTRKHADQLTQTTHDIRARVANCTEVEDGIFRHLWWTVTKCVI